MLNMDIYIWIKTVYSEELVLKLQKPKVQIILSPLKESKPFLTH